MYPNRKAIETIKNQFLKVAMYTAEGEERECLEKAFPECYSENKDELCVPASLLRMKRRAHFTGCEYASEYIEHVADVEWDSKTLNEFGIPIAFAWSNTSEDSPEAPQEIWDQLIGKEIRSGIEVEYLGTKLLLAFYMNDSDDDEIPNPKIKQPKWLSGEYSLKFVLPQFIDLNS